MRCRLLHLGSLKKANREKGPLHRPLLSVGVFFLCFVSLYAVFSGEKQTAEERRTFAVQNPILRNYFRDLYPQIYSSRFPPQAAFVESFVDGQVENFLREVAEHLEEIRRGISTARKLRERVVANSLPGGDRRVAMEAQIAFRTTMRRVEDSCDDLGDKLDLVFRAMDRDKDFDIGTGSEEFFGTELDILDSQFEESERLIHAYLFSSTNTVDFADLKGENMLTRLYRAKELAKYIREQLR